MLISGGNNNFGGGDDLGFGIPKFIKSAAKGVASGAKAVGGGALSVGKAVGGGALGVGKTVAGTVLQAAFNPGGSAPPRPACGFFARVSRFFGGNPDCD